MNQNLSKMLTKNDILALKRIDRGKLRNIVQLKQLAKKVKKLPEESEMLAKAVMNDIDIHIPWLNFKALRVLEMVADGKVVSTIVLTF